MYKTKRKHLAYLTKTKSSFIIAGSSKMFVIYRGVNMTFTGEKFQRLSKQTILDRRSTDMSALTSLDSR